MRHTNIDMSEERRRIAEEMARLIDTGLSKARAARAVRQT
jgi:hypothetical protein